MQAVQPPTHSLLCSGGALLLRGPDVQLPIQLAKLLAAQSQYADAINVLQAAAPTTPPLLHPLLALQTAQVCLARGDPAAALIALQGVPPASPWAVVAQVEAATVHLQQYGDTARYVAVYERLAEQHEDLATLRMLGDAYRTVGDEAASLRVLQAALDAEPGNVQLAVEVGRHLIEVHEYRAAADVYTTVLLFTVRNAAAIPPFIIRRWHMRPETQPLGPCSWSLHSCTPTCRNGRGHVRWGSRHWRPCRAQHLASRPGTLQHSAV